MNQFDNFSAIACCDQLISDEEWRYIYLEVQSLLSEDFILFISRFCGFQEFNVKKGSIYLCFRKVSISCFSFHGFCGFTGGFSSYLLVVVC